MADLLDSGNRRDFGTGAVRDMAKGKGRCDLFPMEIVADLLRDGPTLSHIDSYQMFGEPGCLMAAISSFTNKYYDGQITTALLEAAKQFEDGAEKYGENNWQKGIPTKWYIDSAVRHYLKFLRGDTDEPHDRAFIWNLLCCIWTCHEEPALNSYYKEQ